MKGKVGNLNCCMFKVLPHRRVVCFMFARSASQQRHWRQMAAQKCKMFMDDFIRIVRPARDAILDQCSSGFASECFLCESKNNYVLLAITAIELSSVLRQWQRTLSSAGGSFGSYENSNEIMISPNCSFQVLRIVLPLVRMNFWEHFDPNTVWKIVWCTLKT